MLLLLFLFIDKTCLSVNLKRDWLIHITLQKPSGLVLYNTSQNHHLNGSELWPSVCPMTTLLPSCVSSRSVQPDKCPCEVQIKLTWVEPAQTHSYYSTQWLSADRQSQPWISVSFPSSKFLPSLEKPVRLGDSNRKTSVQCLHLVSPSRCRTQQRCINSGCLEQGVLRVGGANTGPGCFLYFSLVEDPSLRVWWRYLLCCQSAAKLLCRNRTSETLSFQLLHLSSYCFFSGFAIVPLQKAKKKKIIIPLLPTAGNICFFLGWRSSPLGHHEACQWRKLVIGCRRKHQYP